jgi:hypothetical protein
VVESAADAGQRAARHSAMVDERLPTPGAADKALAEGCTMEGVDKMEAAPEEGYPNRRTTSFDALTSARNKRRRRCV